MQMQKPRVGSTAIQNNPVPKSMGERTHAVPNFAKTEMHRQHATLDMAKVN